MHARQKKRLLDLSTAPYRPTGYFNYRWARGKLRCDPIFTALIQREVVPDRARILDLGCGRGLLATWLLGAERLAARGEWHDDARPPTGLRYRGVDLMKRDTECGNRALRPLYGDRVRLIGGDMRDAELEDADVVALLDVLHYIPHAEQDRLLDRIRGALGPQGILIARVGNADGGARFAFSQWLDRGISFARGHRMQRVWCRPLQGWLVALEQRGFAVEAIPMSAGTPFDNVMLVARAT
jgi:SAM-dependent methyltransferase